MRVRANLILVLGIALAILAGVVGVWLGMNGAGALATCDPVALSRNGC